MKRKVDSVQEQKMSRKMLKIVLSCTSFALSLAVLAGCGAKDDSKPLWEVGDSRNKIVVISDIHLGINDAYSEINDNVPVLIEFLKRLQVTTDVSELVIAGDFLDEWFLPVYFESYTDSTAFYQACVDNNQDIIEEFNNVIESGIQLVYVIGNHDMLLEASVLEEAIPGIVHVSDARGVGAYYTGEHDEIAIEHGHRYDPFSAPDTLTNAELVGNDDTILPSGYFYARYGATWVIEGEPENERELPVITDEPEVSDTDQYGAFMYYQILQTISAHLTPNEPLEEDVFDMHFAGFDDSYSFLDFYPAQEEDGTISAPTLYRNIQRTWADRQVINNVNVPNSFIEAAPGALSSKYFSDQAKAQYIENDKENVDIVIFGHTHNPILDSFGDGKYYINTGTWIDENGKTPEKMRTFTVIETGETNTVGLYKYDDDGLLEDYSSNTTITA
jgi:UDP-2,3-diacylglucosamine pyrophosphatase LpxH